MEIGSSSCSDMAGPREDFGIVFNDPELSDRVLHIEVLENSLDKENVVEVKTLHVSAAILAGKSPYFHKLFKNGMRESQQKEVTLEINASEVAALMEVLKFMYIGTLSGRATLPDLLGVLLVADKFQVTSCISYCSLLLKKIPMSPESAVSYLEFPTSVVVGGGVQPLIYAAKEYLVARYSDFNMSTQHEVMGLPLCAIEVVLGSDGLQVDTEDNVFEFVLDWAREHYPKLEERREILTKRLARYICFSYMSCSMLKEVLVCPDFVYDEVSRLVIDALLNAEVPNCNSLGRIYKHRPIKVVQFEFPQPRCVVYFDLKKEECANLSESCLKSQSFCLGGRWFYLAARFSVEEQSFGLFLCMTGESERCTVDCEFAVIKKSSKEFQDKLKCNFYSSELVQSWGYPNLFGIRWREFMNEDSEYFVDRILHLRADLTINNTES